MTTSNDKLGDGEDIKIEGLSLQGHLKQVYHIHQPSNKDYNVDDELFRNSLLKYEQLNKIVDGSIEGSSPLINIEDINKSRLENDFFKQYQVIQPG